MAIEFRKLATIPELELVSQLELLVWGESPVPVHQTLTSAKHGGVLIGAWDGATLAGFVYSFPGYAAGDVYLYSHMMGVHPDYRNQGIGYRLKMAQAEEARRLGYRKIRWTYDPLQGRNAYLNIAKLGAVCSEYIENCYGEMQDTVNKGVPSDRFCVDWHIGDGDPASQKQPQPFDETRAVLTWTSREDGLPAVAEERLELVSADTEGLLFLPIPVRFAEMKEVDLDLTLQWRMSTRKVCQAAFAKGYAVVDLLKQGDQVLYYVLAKGVE